MLDAVPKVVVREPTRGDAFLSHKEETEMKTRTILMAIPTAVLLSLLFLTLNVIRTDLSPTAMAQLPTTHTASLQHLKLDQMVDRSGRIFRGRVLDFQPGTVDAGGGKLPTVTYRMLVEEAFKGDFPESNDGKVVTEITMLGSLKEAKVEAGSKRRLSSLPVPPELLIGGDYLLILTAESEVGLSAPVGLGQGAFTVFEQDKQTWAKNEFDNAGLFTGPVKYEVLASKIRAKGGKK